MADSRYSKGQLKAGQIATQEGAIDTSRTYILGVFGPKNALKAMIQDRGGRPRVVSVGDRISLGPIKGIDQKGILVQQGGQTRRLPLAN